MLHCLGIYSIFYNKLTVELGTNVPAYKSTYTTISIEDISEGVAEINIESKQF